MMSGGLPGSASGHRCQATIIYGPLGKPPIVPIASQASRGSFARARLSFLIFFAAGSPVFLRNLEIWHPWVRHSPAGAPFRPASGWRADPKISNSA